MYHPQMLKQQAEENSDWVDDVVTSFVSVFTAIETGFVQVFGALASELRSVKQDLNDVVGELLDGSSERPSRLLKRPIDLRSLKEVFVGAERQAQAADLEGDDAPGERLEQRSATKQLLIGTGTVGVTLLSGVFGPGLLLVSAAGLLYQVGFFLREAYRGLVEKHRFNIYALNVVMVIGAFLSGSVLALTLGIWFGSLLRWIIAKTEDLAQKSIHSVFHRQPRTVWLLLGDVETQVPFEQLRSGDTVVISAGDMIPVDGEVTQGMASVDQQVLTGEAQPIDKGVGDRVLASSIVLQGRLYVRVERSGKETVAAQIGRILADTSDYKRELNARAEEHQDRMTIPFLALSGITAATQGLDSALGVLWSTPGYRMIFVGPLTMLSFMHVASRKGILLKSGRALERLYSVDTVVFDKTGTLTLAQPTMGEIFSFAGLSEQDILKLAVAAEGRQTHPIAVAIRSAARQRAIVAPSMDDPEVAVGFGVKAVIEGRQILVGSERLMKLHGVAFTPSVEAQQKSVHEKGNTLIFIASEGSLVGAIEVCPTVRPEARTLIEELMRRGKRVHILSGDHDEPTRSLAARLGVDSYFAEILPEGKAKIIDSLRAKGHKICFVGDGINDSIAMQRADVSISIRGAASLATTIAQIVLLSGDLETLLPLFDMTERFEWYMKVNRLASSLPAFIISAGIMLLGWSYLTAILLNQISMPFALYSLFGPALEHQAEEAEKKCARALPNVAHGLTS